MSVGADIRVCTIPDLVGQDVFAALLASEDRDIFNAAVSQGLVMGDRVCLVQWLNLHD